MRRSLQLVPLLTALTLAACGQLPEPFLGNPGATARRLAQPMTPRLVVPPPADAMLPDAASRDLADDLATALQMEEVPAMSRSAQSTDWQLVTSAEQRADAVVPKFSVRDPQGKEEGAVEGAPIEVAAWAAARPATLREAAAEAAPKIAATLTSIRIAHDRADPNSLYNRAARVLVADVTGAPGDGNDSLTRQMRAHLAVLGPVVLTTAAGADFTVQGRVTTVPVPERKQRVEVQWTVTAADGSERGKVVQLNEIPVGTLDHYWGDVAVVVATEAAAGINDVLQRQAGREPAAIAAGAAGSSATATGQVSAAPTGQAPATSNTEVPASPIGPASASPTGLPPAPPTGLPPAQPLGQAPVGPLGQVPVPAMGQAPASPLGQAPVPPIARAPAPPTGQNPATAIARGEPSPQPAGPSADR